MEAYKIKNQRNENPRTTTSAPLTALHPLQGPFLQSHPGLLRSLNSSKTSSSLQLLSLYIGNLLLITRISPAGVPPCSSNAPHTPITRSGRRKREQHSLPLIRRITLILNRARLRRLHTSSMHNGRRRLQSINVGPRRSLENRHVNPSLSNTMIFYTI